MEASPSPAFWPRRAGRPGSTSSWQTRQPGNPAAKARSARLSCQHDGKAFTSCTVTYTAPASVQATGATYIVATVVGASSKATSVVLVNSAGVTSNPATHQAPLPATVAAGQLRRQQHGLRHARQPDCGLLQRHAGRARRGRRQAPVPAEQQPRAGAKRPRQRGRHHRPAGTDRQQLHAHWRWHGRGACRLC